MLAVTAAIGGIAINNGRVCAQVATRIEKFDPVLDNIISTSEPVRELAAGMGGPLGPVEGPVWWKEGGYLLFSDIQASTSISCFESYHMARSSP
jgi:sugar lactone lactonase YvrE